MKTYMSLANKIFNHICIVFYFTLTKKHFEIKFLMGNT